jgi:F-type H+-transporting ATPase subunit a
MITEMLGSVVTRAIVPMVSGFSWYHYLPGIGDGAVGKALGLPHVEEAWVIPAAWASCLTILLLAGLARMGLDKAMAREGSEKFIPDSGVTARNLLEVFVELYYNLVEGVLGAKEAPKFFPMVGALFLYIVTANLIGLIPGNLPVTENFSSNLSMSLCVFLMFNYAGLTRNGFAYVKHLWGPVFIVGFLLFPIELFGLALRPFSLTVRLSANMYADHLVSGSVRDVAGDLVGTVGRILAPIPFYGLGAFVCILQGFVYSILSTVYVGLSTADMSHGHDDHDHQDSHHPEPA